MLGEVTDKIVWMTHPPSVLRHCVGLIIRFVQYKFLLHFQATHKSCSCYLPLRLISTLCVYYSRRVHFVFVCFCYCGPVRAPGAVEYAQSVSWTDGVKGP